MDIAEKLPSGCQTCSVASQCLPSDLNMVDVAKLEALIGRSTTYKKGSFIFEQGQVFKSLYLVRSGCVKTYSLSRDGIEQISSYYLAGELFGIDGIANKKYTNFAASLGTAAVCKVEFQQLMQLATLIPALQHRILHSFSAEIIKEQKLARLLSKYSAIQRAAAFFIELCNYQEKQQKGFDEHLSVQLPMTKAACANYLGLSSEAYSRVLSQMQDQGLILIDARLIKIQATAMLKELIPHE